LLLSRNSVYAACSRFELCHVAVFYCFWARLYRPGTGDGLRWCIMVLFLFVIMLLGAEKSQRQYALAAPLAIGLRLLLRRRSPALPALAHTR